MNFLQNSFTALGNHIIEAPLMYTADQIKQEVAKALPGANVQIIDTTGTGDHFHATVIWEGFKGRSLLEQHQMVMAPLQEGLKEAIHALSIKTKES